MTAFTVTVDDTEVRAALAALARRAGNPRPFLLAIGEDIMERAKRRFETGTDPAGRRWQPNARATIEAFVAGRGGFGKRGINKKGQGLAMGKKPLIGETGSLRWQFHVAASGNAVTVGNSMAYAAIHQFGGKAGRGRKVTIPARPFLPVTASGALYPAEKTRILDALNEFLM